MGARSGRGGGFGERATGVNAKSPSAKENGPTPYGFRGELFDLSSDFAGNEFRKSNPPSSRSASNRARVALPAGDDGANSAAFGFSREDIRVGDRRAGADDDRVGFFVRPSVFESTLNNCLPTNAPPAPFTSTESEHPGCSSAGCRSAVLPGDKRSVSAFGSIACSYPARRAIRFFRNKRDMPPKPFSGRRISRTFGDASTAPPACIPYAITFTINDRTHTGFGRASASKKSDCFRGLFAVCGRARDALFVFGTTANRGALREWSLVLSTNINRLTLPSETLNCLLGVKSLAILAT